MKILSIYPYTHISSAAIMINGKIIAASAEERFNRVKMSTDFPIKSINWCLKEGKLDWKDIDLIVVPWNPSININDASRRWTADIRWRGEMYSHIPAEILRLMNGPAPNKSELILGNKKITFFNHHECHAASAFFTSPFKNADILTIDGHGEKETCFFGYGKNKNITQIKSIDYPHSLGLFYGTFTDFLGYKADSDEWKVMALSSFSSKKNIYDKYINKLILKTKSGFELNLSYFDYYTFDRRKNFFSEKFIELFGQPRKPNSKILKKHYEIAGALQRKFEEIASHLLRLAKKFGKNSGNIVLAGGAAMNCVFNGNIEKLKIYKKNYIPGYPDDLGVTIGAALLANSLYSRNTRKIKEEEQIYFGPKFSNKEIKKILNKNKINFSYKENINEYVAKKISEKKLVGWFQGKMEFGHRALGNRSILADPRHFDMKDIINSAVKYRESYRPFAPAVLGEYASKIFEIDKNEKINFMQKAVKVRKNWKKKIPAITHVDGTARVQTVYEKNNRKFYKLISEFNKITNVPVILNTSFNLNGEPIVCNPEDAIKTFFTCGLDILVLENFIVEKK